MARKAGIALDKVVNEFVVLGEEFDRHGSTSASIEYRLTKGGGTYFKHKLALEVDKVLYEALITMLGGNASKV